MSNVVVVTSSGFPQNTTNRTRTEAVQEIASYLGGENDPEMQRRAGRALDAAVRVHNTVLWRFNRLRADITLTADGATPDYALQTNFKAPDVAKMVDSNSNERNVVDWVPYNEWLVLYPDRSGTGAVPQRYTIRNVHETGLVTVDPTPATSITYPTFRLYYYRRIVRVGSGALNVPEEVDESIMQYGLARFVHMQKSRIDAAGEYADARVIRLEVEREWRAWPDVHYPQ